MDEIRVDYPQLQLPKNIVFHSDFELPHDVHDGFLTHQYKFAEIDLEVGLRFFPDELPFPVEKKDLAKQMIRTIMNVVNHNNPGWDPQANDISFNIDGVVVMCLSQEGIVLDHEPSRPYDYWVFKEFEKQWKSYIQNA